MLKAVIFDMDGVLVDTEPLADLHFSKFLKTRFNIDVEPEFFQRFRGNTSKHFWEIIIKEFNLETTYGEIIEIAQPKYLDFLVKSGLQPIPGVVQLISNLLEQNIKIAVASSASQKRIITILKIINLSDKFEVIISADHIKNSKPHPEIYLIAAKTLNVDPKDCIAIEDATNGVKSAKAAGMKVIAYKDPQHNMQDLSEADVVVKHFEEINLHKFQEFISWNICIS